MVRVYLVSRSYPADWYYTRQSTMNQDPAAAQEPHRGGLRLPERDTDFKEKYPPDRELGHELDDIARVWKVYRGEAIDHDDALLKTWNETVNILLTFAGLFSAAVTSFVATSTDDLKPDPNAYVANLLFAMGNANGGASPFAHLPAPPPLEAAPTSLARIVNGFWYTSLFLSLAAALLCILVKQWLDEYTARTRGSAKHPRQWAQRRSFYFQGLTDWHVAAIISFLPLFLHLALFLFLAGLTVFLWDLDSAIRWVMLALMSVLLAVYLVSLFLPVWSSACPYATPLLAQLRNLGYTALVGGYSDAVAVAWQSLGALLEEPKSFRSTRVVAALPGLVEDVGGHTKLWRTLRLDGILDDCQLDRITRSALFITSSRGPGLFDILYFSVPDSDAAYLKDTLSPDAALVYAFAFARIEICVVKVVRRLYEQGSHRPLPSTAMFLVSQLDRDSDDIVPEAAIGLLYYCRVGDLPATSWTHVASLLGQGCTGREANTSHRCDAYCVVNALCACALLLIEDETSGISNSHQSSAAPFDAYCHVQLCIRILDGVPKTDTELSAAVWSALTDTRYLSRRIQREDQIRAVEWARALCYLARSSDRFYASFGTQYNTIWSMLLRGFIRNHPTVVLEGIDFDEGADDVLMWLGEALVHVTPWWTEIVDPALRHARLQSALALIESASIAFYSRERDTDWGWMTAAFVSGTPLLAFFPSDLALTKEAHNDWVDLLVSTIQHIMVLDPLPWNNLRDAVTASTDNGVKSFFSEVHTRLTEVGPCMTGDCAGQGPADWVAALGPVP
ncbi:hypothetical protein EXIGLDRAFT_768541 [Exidia glandulosa HHB12029]|uniref:DUF6535 domain-containing protein n=1 Tax=Exidia glandulosa HHB12029 TaxID=1314781 RepID=A0A165I5E7_EXIGL|nr:hypothetical protein EXIGLDRAFT_768541 [Exidia glandulosa HHB12029]